MNTTYLVYTATVFSLFLSIILIILSSQIKSSLLDIENNLQINMVSETGTLEKIEIPGNIGEIFKFYSATGNITDMDYLSGLRLAGTFIVIDNGCPKHRKAVIEDIKAGGEYIVCEGESIREGLMVYAIYKEKVEFVTPDNRKLILRLTGDSSTGQLIKVRPEEYSFKGDNLKEEVLSKFGGRQTGPRSWEFNRDAIIDYYRSLLKEPDKLLKVFDSLEPVYGANNTIDGYIVNIKGEKDFFEAVGLSQGEIIREVNGLKMTSRRRAEYLIKQFIEEGLNVFVVDVELQNGSREKRIYRVR